MLATTTREAVVDVVERYINGLGNRDFSRAALAPDISFESPISPKRTGQDVIDFLSGLFPIITGVKIREHVVEGNLCATVFDLYTTEGTLHIFDRFCVEEGQLKSINPYYDPRLLTDAQVRGRRAQLTAIAEAYFAGLAQKDLSAVPWATDVILHSPLAPGGLETPLVGRQAVRDWFAQLYPVLGATQVLEHYFSEDLTVIASRADVGILQPPATLRVVDRFTVNAAGEITAQENHYDPRPALAPV
jgi:hypothetical protein